MAARLIYALTILVCLALALGEDQKSDTHIVVQSCNKFSIDIFKQTNAIKPKKNLVTAGSFVWIILSLLSLGATGPSRNELKQVLGIEKDPTDFQPRVLVPIVVDNIKKIKGIVLEQATRFYIRDDGTFTTDDYDVDAYRYGVEIDPLKLSNVETGARTINEWVQKSTHNRVKGLISAKDLDPKISNLIIINSLFLKATWDTAFDTSLTRNRPFYLLDGQTVNVPTMETTGNFRFGHNKQYDAELLAIPLKGNQASVVFALPSKRNGLPDLIKKLTITNGTNLFTSALELESGRVKARIPKIMIETTSNLKTMLPKLGINLIFQHGKSGLTYILDSGAEVDVTHAIQKNILLIDEKGENEYDDSVDVGTAFSFLFVSTPKFYADHPYLAAVVPHNGPILYLSQIVNPSL